MEQPTDSSQQLAKPGYVCELIRSLYGTRQAGEIWSSHLDKTLKQWGFKVPSIDNRVYFLLQGGEFLMLAIVVDDIAFSSTSPNLMERVKSKLSATFSVKIFGQLKSFVGRNVNITDSYIKVDQRSYARKLLQEHGMESANAVHTPLPVTADVTYKKEDEEQLSSSQRTSYRYIIGVLLYLSVGTRPDISYSVSALARHCHAPTKRHMSLVKRILRYVAGTVTLGLKYPRSGQTLSPRSIAVHVDADWDGCKDTRR